MQSLLSGRSGFLKTTTKTTKTTETTKGEVGISPLSNEANF
jgi:hypothetical protein